jgi:ketosteroid isomerase-like protein
MTTKTVQAPSSQDEMEIQALIERWARAVREENRAGIRADHDSDMLMFDVPPPLLSRGLDAYMATWEKFFLSWSEKPVAFEFHDVKITAGNDVAFRNGDRTMRGHQFEPQARRARISIDHVSQKA